MRSSGSAALQNLALIAATLLAAFVFGEIAIRVWQARAPVASENNPSASANSWIVPDPDMIYRLRPGVGGHNADGLNGPPTPPKTSTFRILMLGDSLIYGVDNFVNRAAEILAKDPTLKPSEFLNAGTPGYTNYQEMTFLKNRGVALQPDLVGVVFVLNDLHKFLNAPVFNQDRLVGDTFWGKWHGPPSPDTWLQRLYKRSHLLVRMGQSFQIAEKTVRLKFAHGYDFDYNTDFNTAWMDREWPVIEDQLRQMVELSATKRARMFLVAVPYAEQLRKDYLARDTAYVTKPQRKLKQICQRMGIPYLDLMPFLDHNQFVSDLIHLTPEGKAVAGTKLAEFLLTEKLIPSAGAGDRQ